MLHPPLVIPRLNVVPHIRDVLKFFAAQVTAERKGAAFCWREEAKTRGNAVVLQQFSATTDIRHR